MLPQAQELIFSVNLVFNLDLEASNLDSTSYKFLNKVKDVHPYLQVNNIHMDLASLRMIKDELEIKAIKEAIKTTNAGLNNVMKHLEGGRYEYEMVAHYLHILNLENKKNHLKRLLPAAKMRQFYTMSTIIKN